MEVITNTKIVCPFRSEVHVKNDIGEDGIPYQTQITYFPECHYASCPFYDSTAKDSNDKCIRVSVM